MSCRFGRQGDWHPTCWQTAHFLYTSHILCCAYGYLNIRSDYIHLENQQSRELISAQRSHTHNNNKDLSCTQRSHTQQQQRSELPTETLTWHASKYMAHKVHQRYILKKDVHNSIIIIYGAPSHKSPERLQKHKDTLITHTQMHVCTHTQTDTHTQTPPPPPHTHTYMHTHTHNHLLTWS